MNARELAALMERGIPYECGNGETTRLIIHALSLLAAAEANDGSTPEFDSARKMLLGKDYYTVIDTFAKLAKRFEQQCNGLAAEVLRLTQAIREGMADQEDAERFRALPELMFAIVWMPKTNLPALGSLKDGFSLEELQVWIDDAMKGKP